MREFDRKIVWGPVPEDAAPTNVEGLYSRNGSGYPEGGDAGFEEFWYDVTDQVLNELGTDRAASERIEEWKEYPDGEVQVTIREWISGYGYAGAWVRRSGGDPTEWVEAEPFDPATDAPGGVD